MADPIDNRLIDKRVAHRYLRKALLDEKDFERHLKGLQDLADRAVPIEASMEGDEVDDLDDEDAVEGADER
jgi:hypothetical protein